MDTIGAGDTFNAAVICALLSGAGAEGAIMFGCAVAGVKVGHMGLGGVVAAGVTGKSGTRQSMPSFLVGVVTDYFVAEQHVLSHLACPDGLSLQSIPQRSPSPGTSPSLTRKVPSWS